MTTGKPKSGVHWTQTPEGRKRIGRMTKARAAARAGKPTKRSKVVRAGFRTTGFGKQGYADKIKVLINSMSEEGAKSLLLKYILES